MELKLVPELQDVAEKLKSGRPVEPVTVRTFLWWFGAQRRGFNKVRKIREELSNAGIETFPDFEDRWVDAPISFQLVSPDSEAATVSPGHPFEAPIEAMADESVLTWVSRDPTHRISKLAAANQAIISVRPDTPFQEVITLLLARDFSQLPVMITDRIVKGVVSWKTIGARLAMGRAQGPAQEFMEDHHEVRAVQSIFEAIPLIHQFDYVLVRGGDNRITGIVTASDLSAQFRILSEPFLLLSEIENIIRNMIGSKFSILDLNQAREPGDVREVSSVDDLTFGEYLRLLQNPICWAKIGLSIDRGVFCKDLDAVRLIRNDVTHFDPDGVTGEELERLRDFKAFLQNIERIAG